ncbi:MAG: hypothetical protein EZS28_008540 [Streblomastix strix]|uniref:Right handed beta helix domain-containing protein n=1 Tax=Streblomastix strix TaxID=222440 RepID=A0A5J4WNF4_9EUKA|nr:MAG: hypothetical protein EZS28_008540 [Streblomastix strix]
MLLYILLAFLSINSASEEQSNQKSGQNVPFNLYVKQNSQSGNDCGSLSRPCSKLEQVFHHIKDGENLIHVYQGTYELPLSSFQDFELQPYPYAEVVAEEEVQINITSPIHSISKIRFAFSFIHLELGELYFTVDDDESSLKFSNCNLLRDDGNTAINAYSLAVVNRGSIFLENLDVDGGNQLGSQSLIQATSPKLIHFTSLHFTNLALKSGSTAPLLLNVNEIHQNSLITISDIHVNKNTAGSQANAGIIFVRASDAQTKQMKNEDSQTEPIFVLENSEIIQNTFSLVSDSCIIQIEGIKPQQILIKNCIIDNRSPFDTRRTYEVKIALTSGSISQNLISQFQTVEFGPTFSPVAVKLPPNTSFTTFALPLDDLYGKIKINKDGLETCSSYTGNYHLDVRTLSCAMIVIISQDKNGELKKSPHIISIRDSFTDNDLRTDGVAVSFVGENILPSSNKIIFEPILPFGTSPSDNALFRVRDGGQVTLTNLHIQRSNQIGSENAPVIVVQSGSGMWSNGIRKNAVGQLIIEKCILEGGNSADSVVWYNLGLAETCNVGYGAAIVADGQTIVKISGSTVRTFEGPAVRALNGASIQITRDTILDNNGQRNRNTLSSMLTNVVCEGGSGTTTVDIALDNVTSYRSTGNAWIFSLSESTCAIKATLNGAQRISRSQPQTETANIVITEQKQIADVNVGGRFLEPCMRTLVLEIRQKNGQKQGITQEFGVENTSSQIAWSSSNNVIIQLSTSIIQGLLDSTPWEVSIYEVGQKDSATWVLTEPVIEGEPEPQEEKKDKSLVYLLISIIVPIVVFIIAVIIIFIIVLVCFRSRDKKQSETYHKENENQRMEVDVQSLKDIEKDQEQTAQFVQKKDIYEVDEYTQPEQETSDDGAIEEHEEVDGPIQQREITEQSRASQRQINSKNISEKIIQYKEDIQREKNGQNIKKKQGLKARKTNKVRSSIDSHSSGSSHSTNSSSQSRRTTPRSEKTRQTISTNEDIIDSISSSAASSTGSSFDEFQSTETSSVDIQDVDEKEQSDEAQLKNSKTKQQRSNSNSKQQRSNSNSKHKKKSQNTAEVTNDKQYKSQEVDSVSDNFGSDSQSVMSTENGELEKQSLDQDIKDKQNTPKKVQLNKSKIVEAVKKPDDVPQSDISYQEGETSSELSDSGSSHSSDSESEDKSHKKEETKPKKKKTKRSKKSAQTQSDEISKQDEDKGEVSSQQTPKDAKQEKKNKKDTQNTDSVPPSVEGMQLFAMHNITGEKVL